MQMFLIQFQPTHRLGAASTQNLSDAQSETTSRAVEPELKFLAPLQHLKYLAKFQNGLAH